MRTFIQLQDNIGWAVVRSNEMPDHTNTPANITIVEVFTSEPEQFLKKKYNPETTSWSDVDLITFAEVNNKGSIIEIKRTYFNHEVTGPIITEDIPLDSKWINDNWVISTPVEPAPEYTGPTETPVEPLGE